MEYSNYRKQELNISDELNKWFRNFCDQNPEYKSIESFYIKKGVHLNGVQFVAGFRAYTKDLDSWKRFAAVPIAIELVMIWAYKTNRILDHKQEAWSSEKSVKGTVLDHDLLLSCILTILKEQMSTTETRVARVQVLQFLADLPVGFLIEQDYLNSNNSSLESIKAHWQQKYIERNIKFNSLYDAAPIIGYMMASGNDIFQSYIKTISIEWRFSYIGQVINDLSDCIPEHDIYVKSYQDQCADIRNGIITYPIFELLDSPLILKAIENPGITRDFVWQKSLFALVKEKSLDSKVKDMAEHCYQKHVNFWSQTVGISDEFLFATYALLRKNKYFKKFEQG